MTTMAAAYDLYSDAELRKDLAAIISGLPEITETWEERKLLLQRLQAIAQAIAAQPIYVPTLLQILPELRAVLLIQLTDLRSLLLGSLFAALAQLGHTLEAQFGAEAEHYVPALLGLVRVKKAVIASGAADCAQSIIRSTRHAPLLPLLLSAYRLRNCSPTRLHCVNLVITWVQSVHGSRVTAASADLLSFVDKALDEGAVQVRERAIKLFVEHIEPLFPNESKSLATKHAKRLKRTVRVQIDDAENQVNSPITTRLVRAATLPATLPSSTTPSTSNTTLLQTRAATSATPVPVLAERTTSRAPLSSRRQPSTATTPKPPVASQSTPAPSITQTPITPVCARSHPITTSTPVTPTERLELLVVPPIPTTTAPVAAKTTAPTAGSSRVTRKRSASSTAAPSSTPVTPTIAAPTHSTAASTSRTSKSPVSAVAEAAAAAAASRATRKRSASSTAPPSSTPMTPTVPDITHSTAASSSSSSRTASTPTPVVATTPTTKPTRTLSTPSTGSTKTPSTASSCLASARSRLFNAAAPTNSAAPSRQPAHPSKPSSSSIDLNPTTAAGCAETIAQLDSALAAKQRQADKRDNELLHAPSIAINHDMLLQSASSADDNLVRGLLASAKSPTRENLESLTATLRSLAPTTISSQPPNVLVELVRILARALYHTDGDAALEPIELLVPIIAESLTTLVLEPANPPSAFVSFCMSRPTIESDAIDRETANRHSIATVLVIGIAQCYGSSRQSCARAAERAFAKLAASLPLVPTLLSAIRRERARTTEPRIALHRSLLCFMATALGSVGAPAVDSSVVLDVTRVLLLDSDHQRTVIANAARDALTVISRTQRSALQQSRALLQPQELEALVALRMLDAVAAAPAAPVATPRKSAPLPVPSPALAPAPTPRKSAPLPASVAVPAPAQPAAIPVSVPVPAQAPTSTSAPTLAPKDLSNDSEDDDDDDGVITFNKPPKTQVPAKASRSAAKSMPLPPSAGVPTIATDSHSSTTTKQSLVSSSDAVDSEDLTIELPSTAPPAEESIARLLAAISAISTDDKTLPQAAMQMLALAERILERLRSSQHHLAPSNSAALFNALLPFAGVFIDHELLAEFEAVMLYLYSALRLVEDERRRLLVVMCEALASHGATIKAANHANVLDTLHGIVFDLIANASDAELVERVLPTLLCTREDSGFGLHVITELLHLHRHADNANRWRAWLPFLLPVARKHLSVSSRERPTALKLLVFIHTALPASEVEAVLLAQLNVTQRSLVELHVANYKRQRQPSS